ncbi:hypothetical protein P775_24875 [Puniceibacterium antarcticum]|uniref:Uncharacterized protein n=2 Tax=Puniceibacterium antarcticum TaxID=1206336 RepID=A0A2G8R6K6_9RHOB|nr:hypothetical protein P775_24875 [Puniceibacterium antarcticum]
MISYVAERLMEMAVGGFTVAAYGEMDTIQQAQRNIIATGTGR